MEALLWMQEYKWWDENSKTGNRRTYRNVLKHKLAAARYYWRPEFPENYSIIEGIAT